MPINGQEKTSYPRWDEIQLQLYGLLGSIIRRHGFCPEDIELGDIQNGAFIRLRGYYERGTQRENITRYKSFEAWCWLKCQSAARDERRQLLRESAAGDEPPPDPPPPDSKPEKQSEIDDRINKIFRRHSEKDPVSMDVLLTNKSDKITAAQIAEMRSTTETEIRRIIRKDKRELKRVFQMDAILPKD